MWPLHQLLPPRFHRTTTDGPPLSIYSLPPDPPAKDDGGYARGGGELNTVASSTLAHDHTHDNQHTDYYSEKDQDHHNDNFDPYPDPPYPSSSPPPYRLSSHLQSRSLLLLSVLSSPILGIIIVLVTLLLISATSKSQVAASKREILAGCNSAQKALVALRAVPDLMEEQSRKALVKTVEAGVRGSGKALMLAVTVLEAVLTFLIDSYRSIYMCALELLVFGALALIIGAVEEIQAAMTKLFASLRTLIQDQVATANTVVQAAVAGINKVTAVFKIKQLTIDAFDIPALSSMENVQVGTVIEDKLKQLNSSLPNLNQIREKLNAFIDEPFELVVNKINATTGNFTFKPSPTAPVNVTNLAAASQAEDMCSDLDLSFIDNISNELSKIFKWSVAIIVVVGLIAIAVLLYMEHRRYLSFIERVEIFHAEHAGKGTYSQDDLIELAQFSQANIVNVWAWRGIGSSRRMSPAAKRRGKWLASLISHPLALAPLLIGLLGLLALQLQITAVHAVGHKASLMTASSISDMSTSMTSKLNGQLAARGAAYASGMNADIAKVQKVLDDEVFGEWVNTTTVVLNSTLVEFYDLVEHTVESALGSTIIWPSVNTFLFCILGSKVEALSHALTFIHDHAHFTLPVVPNDIFAIANDTTSMLVRPIAAAAVGGGSDGDEGVVQRLIDAYVRSLRRAMVMHWIFVGLWGAVLVGGVVTIVVTTRQEARDNDPNHRPSTQPLLQWRPPFLSRRQSTAYSAHPEKINTLMDAFPQPPPQPSQPAPFTTPLPSPYPFLPPTPSSNTSAAQPAHTFFESATDTHGSAYPYPVRSGSHLPSFAPPPLEHPTSPFADPLPRRGPISAARQRAQARESTQSPLTALSNWSRRLLPTSASASAPQAPADPRASLRSFHLDPNRQRGEAASGQPIIYETYHTVPSPRIGGGATHPIFAEHAVNPFGDERREVGSGSGRGRERERESAGMGRDPFRTPFD